MRGGPGGGPGMGSGGGMGGNWGAPPPPPMCGWWSRRRWFSGRPGCAPRGCGCLTLALMIPLLIGIVILLVVAL